MASAQRPARKRPGRPLRVIGASLAALALIGWCVGGWVYNTMLLTLPPDGERALVERISADSCGGQRCEAVELFNLSRMDGSVYCANLYVYSALREHSPIADSYMLRRVGEGRWRIEPVPGSVCDTWSPSGRRHVLVERAAAEE